MPSTGSNRSGVASIQRSSICGDAQSLSKRNLTSDGRGNNIRFESIRSEPQYGASDGKGVDQRLGGTMCIRKLLEESVQLLGRPAEPAVFLRPLRSDPAVDTQLAKKRL